MSQTVEMHIIARIRSDFPTKFGIPRQSGLADVPARIVFEPEYRNADALRGIEGFSHLWLIWQFSAAVREGWSPTVRPPKLGGNKRIGVFATRSPFRPNEIGLSSVRLDRVEPNTPDGPVLMCPTDKIVRNMLCLIITKLGSLKMPLSPAEFNKLSAADFDFLAEKYIEMREKSNLDALGRDNQPL